MAVAGRMIVDAQVHLWKAESDDWKWVPGRKPQLPEPFTIEKLVELMDEAGVDRAVIVRSAKQVQGVARRCGERRLVLPLQVRIAVGPLVARDHVDVASGNLRLQQRGGAASDQDCRDYAAYTR